MSKAITDRTDDHGPSRWQPGVEIAPSVLREDEPTIARASGLIGAACVIFGGASLMFHAFGWSYRVPVGWGTFILVVGVVQGPAHGEGHVQAVGRDRQVLDVETVVCCTAKGVGAQRRGDLGLRGAGAGAVTLPQRGAVFVVLDEGAHARHVVLVHRDLVTDVEDREIHRGRVGLLATTTAGALCTGCERRGEAQQEPAGPAPGRDAVRVFGWSIHRVLRCHRVCIAAQACDVMQIIPRGRSAICRCRHSGRAAKAVFLPTDVVRDQGRCPP